MKFMQGAASKVYRLYADGFRSMTVGRTLWLVIIIKLVIMFAVLRLFFMPDILGSRYDNDADRAEAVRLQLAAGTDADPNTTDQQSITN